MILVMMVKLMVAKMMSKMEDALFITFHSLVLHLCREAQREMSMYIMDRFSHHKKSPN
jgi:hypothetical protein